MEKRFSVTVIVVIILAMVLAACGVSTQNPTSGDSDQIGEGLPPVAAVKAREALAAELDTNIEEITIDSQKQVTWSDSCLGLGGPAESCLQTEVDGWLAELSVNGKTYKARTDWLGEQVRFEP